MDLFTSGLPSKGYNTDIGDRKRVRLPGDHGKGLPSGFSYGQSTMYHSTPKVKPTSVSTTVASSTFNPRTTSSAYYPTTAIASMRASRSKSPLTSTNPIGRSISPTRRSVSPSRLHSTSPLSPSKMLGDVDADTIQRQRRELQLLIGELKDRDRELNDMVQAHQKQIVAWEDDRQRVFSLEKRCSRLESGLKGKADQLRALHTRLKAAESEEQSKNKELEETQVHLHQVSEQANTSLHQVQDLEEKNNSLTNSMREMSNTIGQLQAKEQELSTRLKLKNNDVMEASVRLGEMQQKIRRLEGLCQDLKKGEGSLKNDRDHWKDQALASKNEIEKLRVDISKQFNDADEIQADVAKTKQEVLVLQKELFLSGEREKRKDQLLELQKSKQERTDSELQNLRQICERQQRDISYMQMQLQNNHDMFKADSDAGTSYQDSKQVNGGYYDDKVNYQTNADYDNQEVMSTKSLDFEGPTGGTPASNYATIGSDFGDDLESLSQDPSDRQFTSTAVTGPYPNTRPQPYFDGPVTQPNPYPPVTSTAVSDPYPNTRPQPYFDGPVTKPDPYPPLGGLTISVTRPETDRVDAGGYVPFSSVGPVRPSNGYSAYTAATPQAVGPAEDSSPTSKLHRLLAESRQMVYNLEQVSSFPITRSPAKQEPGTGSDQYTPPQRHMGSPLTSHALTTSTN